MGGIFGRGVRGVFFLTVPKLCPSSVKTGYGRASTIHRSPRRTSVSRLWIRWSRFSAGRAEDADGGVEEEKSVCGQHEIQDNPRHALEDDMWGGGAFVGIGVIHRVDVEPKTFLGLAQNVLL